MGLEKSMRGIKLRFSEAGNALRGKKPKVQGGTVAFTPSPLAKV